MTSCSAHRDEKQIAKGSMAIWKIDISPFYTTNLTRLSGCQPIGRPDRCVWKRGHRPESHSIKLDRATSIVRRGTVPLAYSLETCREGFQARSITTISLCERWVGSCGSWNPKP